MADIDGIIQSGDINVAVLYGDRYYQSIVDGSNLITVLYGDRYYQSILDTSYIINYLKPQNRNEWAD